MRIVVKIGTQSLMGPEGSLNGAMIVNLATQAHALRQRGIAIALVSSGAVGAGRAMWKNLRKSENRFPDPVLEKQVLASIGQAALIRAYNKALEKHGMVAAQLLLTRHDFRHRRHSVNVGRLLENILDQNTVLPVINENDSLAVEELIFTDNDELAGLLASQIGADKLIVLTDVDGVYSDPETKDVIPEIDPSAPSAIDVSKKSSGRGGMANKLGTARKMARIGITTHIVRATAPDILIRVMDGERVGTTVKAKKKAAPIKRWLAAGVQETRGRIVVNPCLSEQLRAQDRARSILPVGITGITVPFQKGDVVEITDENGARLGHGLAKYDAETLEGYLEQKNKPVFIHYNGLYVEEG